MVVSDKLQIRKSRKIKKAPPLFSSLSKAELKKRLGSPTLLGFDLDGTLLPIKRHFQKVRLGDETLRLLEKLASIQPVVIISGRGVKSLRAIVGSNKFAYIGNHGLEGLGSTPRQEKLVRNWRKAFEKEMTGIPGFIIEDKKITLTLHYRLVKNKVLARRKILKVLASLPDAPRIILGKLVYNLIPDIGMNKGSALVALMKREKSKTAFFVGDDATDEDVFLMHKKNILTVRVGKATRTEAQFHVAHQPEVLGIIKKLIEVLASV